MIFTVGARPRSLHRAHVARLLQVVEAGGREPLLLVELDRAAHVVEVPRVQEAAELACKHGNIIQLASAAVRATLWPPGWPAKSNLSLTNIIWKGGGERRAARRN